MLNVLFAASALARFDVLFVVRTKQPLGVLQTCVGNQFMEGIFKDVDIAGGKAVVVEALSMYPIFPDQPRPIWVISIRDRGADREFGIGYNMRGEGRSSAKTLRWLAKKCAPDGAEAKR